MHSTEKFIWDTIDDLSGLDEHISFAAALKDRYAWPPEKKAKLEKALGRIRAKQSDNCLNLSIIGEFSSGKSSFINALLGIEILKSSMIQGTTVTNTIIEYSPAPALFVSYGDSRRPETFTPATTAELAALVSRYTTDTPESQGVESVYVGIPSDKLKTGLRIIDTPGTNSITGWHEDVTRTALRDLSDLSIILTDATRPLPVSLLEFMDENLSDIYRQCAVVLTRYDLVPKRERADVLNYVSKKITALTDGGAAPLVTYYCSPAVTGELRGETLIAKDQKTLAEESWANEALIYSHMGQQRKKAQIKKIADLTDRLYRYLENEISGRYETLKSELDFLCRSRETSLVPFIASQKQKWSALMAQEFNDTRLMLEDELDKQSSRTRENTFALIRNAKNLDTLKVIMEKEFAEKLTLESEHIVGTLNSALPKQKEIYMRAVERFHTDFKKEFESLRIYTMELGTDDADTLNGSIAKASGSTVATNFTTNALSQENWLFGGGAVAGAALGTMIMPVIGTIIGGIAGFAFGGWFAPDINKVRGDTITKVAPHVGTHISKIRHMVLDKYDANALSLTAKFHALLDDYIVKYRAEVDRRIYDHRQKMAALEDETRNAAADLELIRNRRGCLESIFEPARTGS